MPRTRRYIFGTVAVVSLLLLFAVVGSFGKMLIYRIGIRS
jgi:hypothetical protein